MPGKFDPSDPVLHECINRAGDPFTDIGLIILIHWVRRVPSVGSALLTWLQQGHWHHQELAARLLTSGVAGQAQHLDSACQAIEHRVVLLEEGQGQPTGLLAALARQYPAAVDALNRISANSMVPTWARASALAAAIQIRGLNAEEAATALRGLLNERRAGAGWSQVIAAEALLHMGEDFHAEAIQILREILADPYTHPNAKENAATALGLPGRTCGRRRSLPCGLSSPTHWPTATIAGSPPAGFPEWDFPPRPHPPSTPFSQTRKPELGTRPLYHSRSRKYPGNTGGKPLQLSKR